MSDTPTNLPASFSDQYDQFVEQYDAATTAKERAVILDMAVRLLPSEYAFNFRNAARRIDEENPIVVPEEPPKQSGPSSPVLDLGDPGAVVDAGKSLWSKITGALSSESSTKGLLSYFGIDDSVEAVRQVADFAKNLPSGFDPAGGGSFSSSPGADPAVLAAEQDARTTATEQQVAAGPTGIGASREEAILRATNTLVSQEFGQFDPTRLALYLIDRKKLTDLGLTDVAAQKEISDYLISVQSSLDAAIGTLQTDLGLSGADIPAALLIQARGGSPNALGRTLKPRQVLLGDQLVMSQTGGLVNEFGELALDSNGNPYLYDAQNPVVFLYELADTEYANWVGQLFDWGLIQTGDDVEVRNVTGNLLSEANAFGLTLEAMGKKYWNPRYGTADGKPRLGGPIQVTSADQIRQAAIDEAVTSLGRGLTDTELQQVVRTVQAMETSDAYARQAVTRAAAMGQTATYEPMGSLEQITNSWLQNNLSAEADRARQMSAAQYLSTLEW